MWVVKIGGSLARHRCLGDWLDAAAAVAGRVVLVPGGGPFADQVRQMQQCWDLDDASAHHMALLAMEQFGLMMSGLDDRLVPAAALDEISASARQGLVPVWMPSRMVSNATSVAANWSVTSDSLALWLAETLQAEGVLLVKSADLPRDTATVASMQRAAVLDVAFHRHASRLGCPICLLNREASGTLLALLNGDRHSALKLAV